MRRLANLTTFAAILGLPILLAATSPLIAAEAAEPATAGATTEGPPGLQAMLALKCNLCHSIDSQGVERKSKSEKTKGPDLSTIGSKHDCAWLGQWLRQEVANAEGKKHGKEFKGTPEQLAQITEWLGTLKKK